MKGVLSGVTGFFKRLTSARARAAAATQRYERFKAQIEKTDASMLSSEAMRAKLNASAVELEKLDDKVLMKLANAAFKGEGVPQDERAASRLWLIAAMKGNADAIYSVGMGFLNGVGDIKQDETKGEAILKDLANKGHGWAAFTLATHLLRSRAGGKLREGETRDSLVAEGLSLYEKAAEKNVAPAFLNLAEMYEKGIGTERNSAKAVEWVQKGAKSGDPMALFVLGNRLATGQGVTRDEKKARRMWEMSAHAGFPVAKYNLALSLLKAKESFPRVLKLLEEAGTAGYVAAMVNAATLHRYGVGTERSTSKAEEWYKRAAAAQPDLRKRMEALAQEVAAEADQPPMPQEEAIAKILTDIQDAEEGSHINPMSGQVGQKIVPVERNE